jgi:hypothetical protein
VASDQICSNRHENTSLSQFSPFSSGFTAPDFSSLPFRGRSHGHTPIIAQDTSPVKVLQKIIYHKSKKSTGPNMFKIGLIGLLDERKKKERRPFGLLSV